MNKLDSEEKEILHAFERGELKRAKDASSKIARHRTYAEAAFKKTPVSMSSRDLRALQARALREGIPYQTLVSSVLHKFVDGQLVDKTANK